MSKFIKLFLAVLLLASCSKKNETSNLTITTETGDVVYMVETAKEVPDLEKGLMFRESLDIQSGMIFDLSKVEQIAMWMKNTKIPLDILFIDKEGVVSWIYENAEPESTTLIIPPFPAVAVLEINAGEVQKNNLKIGDKVKHEIFKDEKKIDLITSTTTDEVNMPASDNTVAASETNEDKAEDNSNGNEPAPAIEEPKPEVLTE